MGGILELIQRFFGILYAPHELAHYLVISRFSPDAVFQVTVPRRDWSHPWIPVFAQVRGSIPPETSLWQIQLTALAPTIIFTNLYLLSVHVIGIVPPSMAFWIIGGPLIVWSLPSGVDLHTASNPEETREKGLFGAEETNADWRWDSISVVLGTALALAMSLNPLLVEMM